MGFRSGQWVKFTGSFKDAHYSKDGKVVGIYLKASTDPVTMRAHAAYIAVVDEKGNNLTVIVDGQPIQIKVVPNQPGLEAILHRGDIPAARIANNPDWQPCP